MYLSNGSSNELNHYKINGYEINKCQIDKYEIIEESIGQGKFGDVQLAQYTDQNVLKYIAIKVIDKEHIKSSRLGPQIRKEIEILSLVDHKFVIKMMDNFEDDKNIYIAFEYCSKGDLYHKIKQEPLEESETKKYIKQLCEAVKYLHSLNIIHRDIKTDNILLTHQGDIKLADFGWATISYNKEILLCGTIDYLAPELVRGDKYDNRIDIWCIGITTYELLCGKPPFADSTYAKTYKNILDSPVVFLKDLSEDCKNFITRVLEKDPEYRLSLDQMLEHPWLKFAYATKSRIVIM